MFFRQAKSNPPTEAPERARVVASRVTVPTETRPPLFSPEELAQFKARVSPLIGFDLDAYKPRQVERRINALFCRASETTLEGYYEALASDPAKLRTFIDGLMINVTEFYRNPEKFEELRTAILPELLARFERLKIWSAGCSMGAELYTVGILLEEMNALDRAELIGTDLDLGVLEKARVGLYSQHEVQSVPESVLARYFVSEGALHRFKGEAIRERARFAPHNLLLDQPLSDCQLILCRNVVIYLSDASKMHLYRNFQQALAPGGILFVGSTERIFDHRNIGLDVRSPFFYQKPRLED